MENMLALFGVLIIVSWLHLHLITFPHISHLCAGLLELYANLLEQFF